MTSDAPPLGAVAHDLPEAARAALAEGGPLARALPGFRPRAGQQALAASIGRAITERGALVAEAGTGTGKTYAISNLYLRHVLEGARVAGRPVVPEGWLAEATGERTGIGQPGRGYGYQWWTYADGSFAARGIFGQGIFIDPKRRLVIASNANWGGGATDPAAMQAREDFYRAVQKAVDDEAGRAAGG